MPRITLTPAPHYPFVTEIQIYISHVNQGGHLDNAQLLTLVSEALRASNAACMCAMRSRRRSSGGVREQPPKHASNAKNTNAVRAILARRGS